MSGCKAAQAVTRSSAKPQRETRQLRGEREPHLARPQAVCGMAWSHRVEGGALGPGLLPLLLQGLPVLHGLLPLCGRLGVAGANGCCRDGRLPMSYVLDALRIGMLTFDCLFHGGKRSGIQGAPLLSCGLSWQSSDAGRSHSGCRACFGYTPKCNTPPIHPLHVEVATMQCHAKLHSRGAQR